MRKWLLITLALLLGASSAQALKLTLDGARKRIPQQTIPAFWIGGINELNAQLAQATTGKPTPIAQSPGGRPIHLISYGAAEPAAHQANFNSAIGGRDASAYMYKAGRKKPVILLIGPVHGHEVEGLTGVMNLVRVMETGKDLRGRDQSALRTLGQKCRLLIIPSGNPDGLARFEPKSLMGMWRDDMYFWGQGTWKDDTVALWPVSKLQHPWAGPNVKFRGCYYDDKGVNAMHDEFFAPMSTEAPAILKVARDEGPDLAVALHSNESAAEIWRPAYLPLEVQTQVATLAKSYYALCDKRKLPHGKVFTPTAEQGANPEPFNLVSAIYHTCGAPVFTIECPHGLRDRIAAKVSYEQILDLQLALYESMFNYALAAKAK